MGRIYTPEEIARTAVPTTTDFTQVLGTFREASRREIKADRLITALVYGSVARGNHSIRSDFDCMLVCRGEDELPAAATVCDATDAAGSGRVQVNASIYTFDELSSGQYENDRFFSSHLTYGQRLIVGTDPVGYLDYNRFPADILFAEYIRGKKRRLGTAFTSTDERDRCKGIERMLELPLAIGRKLLPVLAEIEYDEPPRFDSAYKTQVSKLSLILFKNLGLDATARKLQALDTMYTASLSAVLHAEITLDEYRSGLEELRGFMPEALRWLNLLDRVITRKVETAGNGIV